MLIYQMYIHDEKKTPKFLTFWYSYNEVFIINGKTMNSK